MSESALVTDFRTAISRSSGVIPIPPGQHVLDSPITLRPGQSLVGAGVASTILHYAGDTSMPAFQVDRGCWNFRVSGFTLRRESANGIGMRLCAALRPNHYIGTCCGSGLIEDVNFVGFEKPLVLGDFGYTATSENTFNRCSFYAHGDGGGTAVNLEDYNTLNNTFNCLNLTGFDVGLACIQGGGKTNVSGGSASEIKQSVFNFVTGGQYAVRDYRQGEGGGGRFLGTANRAVVKLDNCEVLGCNPPGGWAVEAYYGTVLTIDSSTFDKRILAGYPSGSISVTNSGFYLAWATTIIDVKWAVAGTSYRVEERGNVLITDASVLPIPDRLEHTGWSRPPDVAIDPKPVVKK